MKILLELTIDHKIIFWREKNQREQPEVTHNNVHLL